MSRGRNIRAKPHRFTEVERELVRRHYADSLTADLSTATGLSAGQIHRLAHSLGVSKSRELVADMARQALEGDHPWRQHRFAPGHTPANKGKTMPDGWAPGRMRETQFKPGVRPHTWMPVGSYRVNPDGALERKVNDLPGPYHVRWHPVSRLVWEEAHGPVPAGHIVVFKPGRRTTVLAEITLDAVECISKRENALRNSIHNLPAPLKEIAQLRRRITRQINKRARAQEASHD